MSTNTIWANFDSSKVIDILNRNGNDERKAWYETQGITLDNCQSMETALKLSGMDFEVKKVPLYYSGLKGKFTALEENMGTIRTDTKELLGIVSPKYEILQNREAFDFLDSMCAQGAKFETAGFFNKKESANYISMSTEPLSICGDEFVDYIMISNGHDGRWGLRVVMTPIRSVCRNTAMLAIKKAVLTINVKHTKNLVTNLNNAKEVLLANTRYMEMLKEEGEKLAVKPFSKEAFEALVKKLYPITEDMGDKAKVINMAQIEHLFRAYKQDDLSNFRESQWGVLQAFADAESHPLHIHEHKKIAATGTPEFKNTVILNMPLLNKVYEMMKESV